jgi:hypothetical protein
MDSTTLTPPVVADVRAAAGLLEKAATASGSVWQLADGDVERGLSLLVRLQALTVALQTVLLAEVESRDLKARTGAPSNERWLADRLRLSRADGGARLRQSAALRRHPSVLDALGTGTVTVEQGEVLAAVLHQVEALPGVEDAETAAAADFLVEQCGLLWPRELARAGQAVVETLTLAPSVDDPAEAAAVAREHDRAERDRQQAERNWLTLTHRPGARRRRLPGHPHPLRTPRRRLGRPAHRRHPPRTTPPPVPTWTPWTPTWTTPAPTRVTTRSRSRGCLGCRAGGAGWCST